MATLLVLYGTSEGQTERVAERVAAVAEDRSHDVDLVHATSVPEDLDPAAFDGVVVADSIHAGQHHRYVTSYVSAHRDAFAAVPSAFVSVSLSAASDSPAAHEEATGYVAQFREQTGWDPDQVLSVPGALRYSEYGWLKRLLMKRIAASQGGDTDTSQDYEYTDWDAVEAFAEAFCDAVEAASSPATS